MANPDPSPETRFGAGNRANPNGKSSAQRKAEIQAAEDSAKLRAKMTAAMLAAVESGEDPLEYLKAEALKLFKDSEDRAHGQPEETVNQRVSGITREIVNAPKSED